jgi:hypothetical protein
MRGSTPRLRLVIGAALMAGVAAAAPGPVADGRLVSFVGEGRVPSAPWHVVGLPLRSKPLTRFEVVPLDGERVLRVEADRSYANLVQPLASLPASGRALHWRWRVDEALADADLERRDAEDMPLRVCALFDLPLQAVPFIERQLLRAVRIGSADDPPAASVCYVWDSRLRPGTTLASPFTRRIRYVVLEGDGTPLHAWRRERRELGTDFLALFGDEAREVPPLVGVAVGADADNTQGHSVGHVAELDFD